MVHKPAEWFILYYVQYPTASGSPEAAGDAGGGGEPAPGGPPRPASVLEALEQRLAKYTEQRDKARVRFFTDPSIIQIDFMNKLLSLSII